MTAVGILSVAHPHAHSYLEALSRIEGVTPIGVADDADERAEAFATEHSVEYMAATELLGRIDAAIVCAETTAHLRWVDRAAAAGVDVLCEKPLAATLDDAWAMVDRCSAAGVELAVAMPVRWADPARQAKAAIEAGELGQLQAIVGTNLLQRKTDPGWMTDPSKAGGGAIMDHSVHVVDLVRWFSEQEITEVYAESGTMFADIPVEDVAILSMTLADGTPVSHDGSWRLPAAWETWGDVTCRLYGTDSVIEVDCFDQSMTLTRDSEPNRGRTAIQWGTDMNETMLRDFLTAIETGRSPAVTGHDGLRELRVVRAAYESVEQGAQVTIDYQEPD